MCGRFFLDADFEDMIQHLNITINRSGPKDYEPRTVFPSQDSLVMIKAKSELRLGTMKWGYLSKQLPKPLINSRAETLLEKPSFRESALRRRCIIPASGYFEWSDSGQGQGLDKDKDQGQEQNQTKNQTKNKSKAPYLIRNSDSPVIYMAGIYNAYENPDGSKTWAYGIITREASQGLSKIHPRMPLVLPENLAMDWLSEDLHLHRLKELLTFTAENLYFMPQNSAI